MPKNKDYDEDIEILDDSDNTDEDKFDDEDYTVEKTIKDSTRNKTKKDIGPDVIDLIGEKVDNWVSGKELVPEKQAQEFLSSVGDKAKLVNSFIVLSGIKRVSKISSFIEKLEEDLFDENAIELMSPKQKASIYRIAVGRVNEIIDNNNKYISNNDTGMDEETQRIITLSKSLNKDSRDKLVSILKELTSKELSNSGLDGDEK